MKDARLKNLDIESNQSKSFSWVSHALLQPTKLILVYLTCRSADCPWINHEISLTRSFSIESRLIQFRFQQSCTDFQVCVHLYWIQGLHPGDIYKIGTTKLFSARKISRNRPRQTHSQNTHSLGSSVQNGGWQKSGLLQHCVERESKATHFSAI